MNQTEFPVTITEAAVSRIRRLIERDGRPNAFLRVGVKGGGCTGLEYVTQVEDAPRENDLIAEYDGVIVRCDPKSATFLEGSILDQSENLMRGLRFQNPNSEKSCGCGSSFTPKD